MTVCGIPLLTDTQYEAASHLLAGAPVSLGGQGGFQCLALKTIREVEAVVLPGPDTRAHEPEGEQRLPGG